MPHLTKENRETCRRLIKTGRWNNESEVCRYGVHLVECEVDRLEDERVQRIERLRQKPKHNEQAKKREKPRTRDAKQKSAPIATGQNAPAKADGS